MNQAEAVLIALPEEVQIELGDDGEVRHRLRALDSAAELLVENWRPELNLPTDPGVF